MGSVYHNAVNIRDKHGVLMRHRWQRYRQYMEHVHCFDHIKLGNGKQIDLCRCGQVKEVNHGQEKP